MRFMIAAGAACLLLSGCADSAGTQCLEDAAGNVLAAGITASTTTGTNGQKAVLAGTTVLKDAAADPSCAAAIVKAAQPTPTPVTPASPAS